MHTSQSIMRTRLGIFSMLASLGVGGCSMPYHERSAKSKAHTIPKKVWRHKKAVKLMQRKSGKVNQIKCKKSHTKN